MRSAMMANATGKHRPSFKMVSNMVIQLLHSIKYSVEVPFSNMAPQPPEIQKSQAKAKVSNANPEFPMGLTRSRRMPSQNHKCLLKCEIGRVQIGPNL